MQSVKQQGRVWGGDCALPKKKIKYSKTDNSLTADHGLLPKEQNTTNSGC